MNNSGSNLPEDLLIEILSLLSIITLLRFKCVCKSWYDLILSPSFTSKHLRNCDNNVNSDHRRFILGHRADPNECDDFTLLSYNTLNVIIEDFRFGLLTHPRLLGSYNGIVCLSDERLQHIAFWNPATRQFKAIQHSDKSTLDTEHAFGYDFKTNDLKAVGITPVTNTRPCSYEIEVYSFKTGSWRNSDAVIPYGFYFDNPCNRPTTFVKGVYSTVAYTQAEELEARSYVLFTVDMSNEVFIVTPMPDGVTFEEYYGWRYKSLTELKELVAFVEYQTAPSENQNSFVISTLNKYGCKGTWKKLYTVTVMPHFYHKYPFVPMGFWRNEKLFLDDRTGGYLVLCDPRTNDLKRVFTCNEVYFQVLECKESLVWISEGYNCPRVKNWVEPLWSGGSKWKRTTTALAILGMHGLHR